MSAILLGLGVPFDRVTLSELIDLPPGRLLKLKCRPSQFPRLFIRNESGIQEYIVIREPEGTSLRNPNGRPFTLVKQGGNERPVRSKS